MDTRRFVSDEFGSLVKGPDFAYFVPAVVPRSVQLGSDAVLLLSRADAALGRLAGVGHLVKDPDVVVRPYLTREAVASSRIEGTQASLSDVLQAQVASSMSDNADIEEVFNYQAALSRGIELLHELPLCLRLAREVHEVLLRGVRGRDRKPGDFRQSPVWIGGRTAQDAIFVPPLPAEMTSALDDWEKFLNEAGGLPVLIRCALMHYQFETIHPFLDGNGRVGRLLIALMLIAEDALSLPLLYMSGYLETNRNEYYGRLQAVRERGELDQWIRYFLEAVQNQATDTRTRIEKYVDLRESYRDQLKGSRNRSGEVVELFFSNPFLTVKRVESSLGVTNQGARNLISSLVDRGWLTPLGPMGRGGAMYWLAEKVYDLISEA